MSITLYSAIRPTGQFDADTQQLEASGEDYDAAKAALEEKVSDGWQLLGISTWPV